jgi:hypothetical protein
VLAENKLIATLDLHHPRLRFPREREIILTDTVGFIRHLPEELKEAFRPPWRTGGRGPAPALADADTPSWTPSFRPWTRSCASRAWPTPRPAGAEQWDSLD